MSAPLALCLLEELKILIHSKVVQWLWLWPFLWPMAHKAQRSHNFVEEKNYTLGLGLFRGCGHLCFRWLKAQKDPTFRGGKKITCCGGTC